MLDDPETKDLLNTKFDLFILDGAYPECALGMIWNLAINFVCFFFFLTFSIDYISGLQYKMKVPFMYLNTVGFYTGSTSRAGSPAPYSITPHFSAPFTDDMNFVQRATNSAISVFVEFIHSVRTIQPEIQNSYNI